MKRNILHTLWAAALLLTACTQEEFLLPATSDAIPFTITVTDGGYHTATDGNAAKPPQPQTRAAENGYRTEFTAGDECGLYIVRGGVVAYENIRLTATAGSDGNLTWQPEADANLGGGLPGERYFLYYPYQAEDMTGKTTASATDAAGFFVSLISDWKPNADQSTYAAYTASDLMIATGIANKDGKQLKLSFSMTHRMAMAVIEMPETVYKFTDNSDGDIPDYIAAEPADFTGSEVQPYGIAPGTYRCIVNPAPGTPTSITGIYAEGKKEFTVNLSGITASSCKTYKVDGATQSEKQTTLKKGDYFCKDSDNKWYIIPGEAAPDGNVIGIVFHAGQHDDDSFDYSSTGIKQEKCHGYVVALTDVHNGDSDLLRWEYGPKEEYGIFVGASTINYDWNGYYNCLKIRKFIIDNGDWEMKHFPAALACETYGCRTLGINGNPTVLYDWQQPLTAPDNTSGWFLPSRGQLRYLYDNRMSLSARMTDVKSSTPANSSYKNYIQWFKTYGDYWSSSEYDKVMGYYALSLNFGNGLSTGNKNKNYTNKVRAVLAF